MGLFSKLSGKDKKPTNEVKVTGAPKTKKKENSDDTASRKKRQLVSPHPDGGWQVKIEGGERATKRFNTKAEAEEYAKKVAKNQNTSVTRRKKDGTFQKK